MNNDELTLRDLWEILKRKRTHLIAFPLFALLIAGFYAFIIAKPVYESRAVLTVAPIQVRARLEKQIELQPAKNLPPEALKVLLSTQEMRLAVAKRLRERGALPPEWEELDDREVAVLLANQLRVKATSERQRPAAPSSLITVELTTRAGEPEKAAEIANLWAELAVERINEIPALQLKANLSALEKQLPAAEQAFRQAQKAWEAFRKEDRRSLWKEELAQVEKRLGAIAQRLRTLPTELAITEAKLRALQDRLARLPERYRLEKSVVGDPVSAAAVSAVGLEALKGLRLEEEVLNPVRQELLRQASQLFTELRRLEAERAALEREHEAQTRRAEELRKRLAAAELEASQLQENLKLAQNTYLALKQKQTDLKIELASLQKAFAAVLARAVPNPDPVAPRKLLILALAGTLGLMLGLFWAFFSAAIEEPEESNQASS